MASLSQQMMMIQNWSETRLVNIEFLETELKRRVNEYPYTPWGRKQADQWDKNTNFIYLTNRWDNLLRVVGDMPPDVKNYAINRWFNFWSAIGVETIFCNLPGVVAAKNPKDRLVDFTIQGIKFDHKTSVFPQQYSHDLLFALGHPEHLVKWLYQNQSTQRRHHHANRLFLILHHSQGDHWKLRAELAQIKHHIEQYVAAFAKENLISLQLADKKILTDILWIFDRPTQNTPPAVGSEDPPPTGGPEKSPPTGGPGGPIPPKETK